MQKKKQSAKNKKILILNFIFCIIIFCCSCSSDGSYVVDNNYITVLDSIKKQLQNGDIMLRLGNDVTSSMFAKLNRTNQSFSHCGIYFKENDTCYVYHSIGGEDNPNEKLRRDKLETFVSNHHNKSYGYARYSITSSQIERLHGVVDSFYKKQIPFDMDFDLQTDTKMYCAEMVYKALKIATKDSVYIPTTNSKMLHFVSTDNIYVNKYATLLSKIDY